MWYGAAQLFEGGSRDGVGLGGSSVGFGGDGVGFDVRTVGFCIDGITNPA